MEKLTFSGGFNSENFVILKKEPPLLIYKGECLPAIEVFQHLDKIDWELGYMVAMGRILPSLEASEYIKMMTWKPEYYLMLNKLN